MRLFKTITICLILISCTPKQRLDRLLNRHPYLATKDTINFIDTVELITNRVQIDTVTKLDHLRRDTFILEREHLKIKTIVYKDSIYVWGQCDRDTITKIIERQIPYDKFEYHQIVKWKKWVWILGSIFFLILIAYVLFRIFRTQIKNFLGV